MSASLPIVALPKGQWVDVYAATGIAVGTVITIQNTGTKIAKLTESVAQPTTEGHNIIEKYVYLTSGANPIGIWALSPLGTNLSVAVG